MLRRICAWITAALALFVLAVMNAGAATAVQRTFVASYGSPANTSFNCSITKPCRAFSEAISVTNPKGEIVVLDSAGYGPVTITKSVSILAPTGIYAGVTVSTGDGITINGAGIVVVLRGLSINGQGGVNGITITNADIVHVENCVISNMGDKGIEDDAGLLDAKDTIVRDNVWGIYVVYSGHANLDRVRVERNATGVAAELGGIVSMQDSFVTGSSNIGVVVISPGPGAPCGATILRSLISSNNFGIYVAADTPSATAMIDASVISDNGTGVFVSSGSSQQPAKVSVARSTIFANDTGLHGSGYGVVFIDANDFLGNTTHGLLIDANSVVVTRGNNSMDYAATTGTVTQNSGY